MLSKELIEFNSLLSILVIVIPMLSIFTFVYIKQRVYFLGQILRTKRNALSAQLNNHFISNTINAIESLVNQGRNEEASEYLIDFSRLLRSLLDQSKRSEITLNEEIYTLKSFLSLEKLRLLDDLEYSISIDPQLDANNIMIPPLMFQPFVENAIWHGIKNKPEPKKGVLKIGINKISNEFIECIIEDNGVGRAKAKAIQEGPLIDQKSWGITLTQERIKYLYKNKKASLELIDLYGKNQQPIGTKARIILPITTQYKT